MKWCIEDRKGRKIAAGTLEQMLSYLKFNLPDGEYVMVGPELRIPTRRHRGVLYPFDQWRGWAPAEAVNRKRLGYRD